MQDLSGERLLLLEIMPSFKISVVKLSLFCFKICSLIECLLKTGRTHQVRLHLTSINSPIIGDKLYGKNKISKFSKNKENIDQFYLLSKFQRQALHAYCLGFLHPISKKYIEFQSEFPKDMKNLLDLLVKY